jgi:hypothetical protein
MQPEFQATTNFRVQLIWGTIPPCRRAYGSVQRSLPSSCAVLLHCNEPGMDAEVACLIAGWLHWYNRMPLQVSGADGCPTSIPWHAYMHTGL